MEAGSSEGSIASPLGRAEDVVDAVFPKLVSWYYNFVGVDDQEIRPTSSGVRDMRWVQQ